MTKELADSVGLVEGEKVLYLPFYCDHGDTLREAIVKEVITDYWNFVTVKVKIKYTENDDELYIVERSELYTKREILKMFE